METVTNTPQAARVPFFSVCLPTYNRGHCLADAIRSTLEQDFQDFELLISDNASTDNTRAAIESFGDPRIKAMYWPKLTPMYTNHNRCIDQARAPWIVFLHSDDTFPAGYLARLFDEINQAEGAEIVCNSHYPEQHALALKLGTNDPL